MNKSFTKIRKIQEANELLESRFLIKEYKEERDKDSNRWYTYQDNTTKKWKIGLETFSPKEVKDPSKDPNYKNYSKYFLEYSTEPNAEYALTKLIEDLKKGNVVTNNNSTTTTTTTKPGQPTTQTTTQSPQTTGSYEVTSDEYQKMVADKLQGNK